MAIKQTTLTAEGLKKMQEQLDFLKSVKRKEVIEAISVARSFGDLSENSEYDEARDEQAKVEAQIKELEDLLKHVKVIHESDIKTDVVNVGALVRVLDMEFEEEIEYTIVGSTEANPVMGKISDQSPIGSALLGAKVGQTVTAVTPQGELQFTVLEISRANEKKT